MGGGGRGYVGMGGFKFAGRLLLRKSRDHFTLGKWASMCLSWSKHITSGFGVSEEVGGCRPIVSKESGRYEDIAYIPTSSACSCWCHWCQPQVAIVILGLGILQKG